MFALIGGQRRWAGNSGAMALWGILMACSTAPSGVFDASPPERLVQVLDRDGQAGLSEEEFEGAADEDMVFSDFDTSGDGVLDADEVRALLWRIPPVVPPRPFARDPREHKPLGGMWGFQGDEAAACRKFQGFVEDAVYHIHLVGQSSGALRAQMKEAVLAGECSIENPLSNAVLAEVAGLWRGAKLLDIFRDMGVD